MGRFTVHLLDFIKSCETDLDARLVTFDVQILFHLYANGPSPSMSVMAATNASLAAFVKTIKRMTEDGLLVVESGVEDRRVRNYDLAPPVRAMIATLLTQHLGPRAA